MLYQFGCALLSVEGDASMCSAVTAGWEPYAVSGVYPCDARLVLHDTELSCACDNNGGWECSEENDRWSVTYCHDGRQQFRLNYDTGNTVDVYVNAAHMHSLKAAVQYAMMLALADRCIGLHGVTVLCGDQVVILSAPSGTGKTTLANLLRQYTHSAVINGDFALLSVDEHGKLIFEPTPFCGSSGISRNVRLRVDRIVFLSQAAENSAAALSARESVTSLMSNSFVPVWDRRLTRRIKDHVFCAVNEIPIDGFAFSPYPQAAEILYQYIHTK